MRRLAACWVLAALWLGAIRRACTRACLQGFRRGCDLLSAAYRVATRKQVPLAGILLWWAWEELQVMLCSVWFIFDPWPVEPGQAMCSARAGFDIGALGVLIVALLAFRLTTTQVGRDTDVQGQGK